MKKAGALAALVLCTVLLCGCFNFNKLEGADIYTTVYPITYLTERLYGENANIYSIYPDGADINEYVLTEKQIKTYSKSDIFIYNGLTDEKQISKEFINNNKNLKIIDVANGINHTNNIEELWLSPNNYLMLASNIKTNLSTLVNNKYTEETITKNYIILEEELSLMDASLRNLGKLAQEKNKEILIVSNNKFRYLENYGFVILSIEDAIATGTFDTMKNNFKSNKYTILFAFEKDLENEYISELNQNEKVVLVNAMYTLTAENKQNNDNYLTIMNQFHENIKNYVLN